MILAAGIGSRLQSLTKDKPKALVELSGKTLLEIQIEKLIKSGIREIIINVHHFPEQIISYLKTKNYFGIRIEISDESGALLETGGGIKKASWFFDDDKPFLVINVDVITDMSVTDMLDFHIGQNAMASLAVRKRSTSRYLLFDKEMQLSGWTNKKTGQKIMVEGKENLITNEMAFSGIHIISPEIFKYLIEEGRFSIIESYLRLASNHRIMAYDHSQTNWWDIGRYEDYKSITDNADLINTIQSE